MGDCSICGEPAGFLKSEHRECREKENARHAEQARALEDLERQATDAALDVAAAETAPVRFAEAGRRPELAGADTRGAIVRGYGNAVERLLDGEGVTLDAERSLARYASAFSLTDAEKGGRDAQTRLVKALILKDVAAGRFSSRVVVSGAMPFLFKKDEELLWLFNDVRFFEVRQFTRYEGRSQGVSVRLMKGVYYRTSVFKGRPLREEHTVAIDVGQVAITQKAFLFAGPKKSLRLPIGKLVGIEPYSDGIGLQKDGTNAKPMTFTPLDGWFAFNLVKNLSALES